MKKFKYTKNIILLTGLIFAITACSKNESPYYDYVNTVQSYDGSAMAYLKSQPKGTFDSLLLVLDRYPDLVDSLENNKLTLFAPVNENFESAIKYLNQKRFAQGKEPLYLNQVDAVQLKMLLCKYIIRGNKTSTAYENERDGLLLNTIVYDYPMHVKYERMSSSGYVSGGASSLNFSNPFGSVFTKDWITTKATTVNINTNNATINILTTIHNFGFDEFTLKLNDYEL